MTIVKTVQSEQPNPPGRRPGLRIGALYAGSRLFAPAEEADLADRFGPDWDAYCHRVKVPWL